MLPAVFKTLICLPSSYDLCRGEVFTKLNPRELGQFRAMKELWLREGQAGHCNQECQAANSPEASSVLGARLDETSWWVRTSAKNQRSPQQHLPTERNKLELFMAVTQIARRGCRSGPRGGPVS